MCRDLFIQKLNDVREVTEIGGSLIEFFMVLNQLISNMLLFYSKSVYTE